MQYRCNSWVCTNENVYESVEKCPECQLRLSEKNIHNDINRAFALSKLYVESHDQYTKEQIEYACTQIENTHKELRKMLEVRVILDEDGGV